HLVSFFIHFLTALLLMAVLRRTLLLPYFAGRFSTSAGWLAFVAALLWCVHPLLTDAIVYATQRTELMMAFFYLATLYCSLRYWASLPRSSKEGEGSDALIDSKTSRHRAFWGMLAVLSCFCGMSSKEVMVSAPLIVFLYERAFIGGSLKSSLRRSWPLYIGLALSWLLLVALLLTVPRPDSAGFQAGVPAYDWWLTQSKIFFLYLKL